MMVQNPPSIQQEFIFLIQTGNKHLEQLVMDTIQEKSVRFRRVETSEEIEEQQTNGEIAAFIIGSDVDDPIQSAQRLHVINKRAKIVLLAQNDKSLQALREAVKFSPFIGSDVICLNESNDIHLDERLTTVLAESLQAERYRSIVAESNQNLIASGTQSQPAFSQHFINKLMDIAPIGIVIVSKEGKVLGWNAKAASIFQRFEAQMLGKSILQLFNKPEGHKLDRYLSESFYEKDVNKIKSLTVEKAERNDKQFLNITAATFTYSEENQRALILAIKDDTEREKARQELQEMNITLEERVEERTASLLAYQDQLRLLASKLSKAEENERQRLATELHDNLGQMLAVNKMKISALQNYPLSDEISLEIENIKGGLNDALTYTRHLMSDLKPPPTLNQEDIVPSIKWLAEKMEKQQLQVTVQDDEHPKPVDDEILTILVQCVRELLFNVIKHSGVKKADIKLIRLKNMVHVIVQDRGKGFVKEEELSASEINGFGLFNISERIDLLGGNIKIETAPGEGTKVTLCAPLKEEVQRTETTGIVKPEKATKEEATRKIKVLLADDHKMMRQGLRKVVDAEEDLTVIAEASNGEEAIKKAKEYSPDIIIMDVNMPVIDGIEATQKISVEMPHARVIALTFHDDTEVMESMRNAGATAYLNKNEAFETLCATIRSEAKLAHD